MGMGRVYRKHCRCLFDVRLRNTKKSVVPIEGATDFSKR